MKIECINESTCIVCFGEDISDQTSELVRQATETVRQVMAEVVTDLVPSYTSLMVCYDLERIDRFGIVSQLRKALAQSLQEQASEHTGKSETSRTIELPVYYGSEVGLDLDDVCKFSGLNTEEVIRIHSEQTYRVYAIGFSPGFAYLGSTDPRIAIPRKPTPRLKVPTGSVGIAGSQTAIYPSTTPGGWQIVGRTPSKMIDWDSDSLALVQVGDKVRFQPVSRNEFIELGGVLDES